MRAVTGLALIAIGTLAGVPGSLAAAPFTLTSPAFKDGGRLAREAAGNLPSNPNCVGSNISPPLAWKNLPTGTKSLVFLMIDPEGRNGNGVTHWVAYGVPVSRTSFAKGEISEAPKDFVGGKSTQGLNHYMGPCTPPNTSDHHYTFIAIATDLEPDALPPNLTKEELLPQLTGHAKGSTGIVGLFRHP